MNRRSRDYVAAVALGLLVAVAVAPIAHSGAGPSEPQPGRGSCQGRPATIIGSAVNPRLRGTHGDDVIITGGARNVWGLRGNDVICATGRTRSIKAGPGNDNVTTGRGRVPSSTWLNAGDDTFIGGARPDSVLGGYGVDHISTGGGNDDYSPQLGGGQRSIDIVDLGPGNDYARTGPNIAGSLDGGTGMNSLTTILDWDEPQGPWLIDNTTMTATRDGELRFEWTSFRRFLLFASEFTGPIVFTGSDADEIVQFHASYDRPKVTAIDMRGGDDRVRYLNMIGPAIGGAGRDRLELNDFPRERGGPPIPLLTADLETGEVHAGPSRAQATEFEALRVNRFVTTVLRGTDQSDTFLVGHACHILMEGFGGDDSLIAGAHGECRGRLDDAFDGRPRVDARGGSGDDLLIGRRTPDLLVGEGGTDTADGREGRDRCWAETRLNCEK